MKRPIRSILLILDPGLSPTPAMSRALALAQALKAQLWIGLFDRGPRLGFWGALDREHAHRLESQMRDQESERLAELRLQLKEQSGLTVRVIDDRERASAERMIEQAVRHDIDLVIKDVGHESALRRLVFLPLDWELLRTSPVPVWLVGAGAQGLPQSIVAAVDPVHPEHGAGALNEEILGLGKMLSDAGAGALRVCSAFSGLPPGLPALDPMGASIGLAHEELYEKLRVEHRDALRALMTRHGLPVECAEMLYGVPTFCLLDAMSAAPPDLLIVGTLRRHGLDRLLMGSTVERLIGAAPCDVLAVPVSAVAVAQAQGRTEGGGQGSIPG